MASHTTRARGRGFRALSLAVLLLSAPLTGCALPAAGHPAVGPPAPASADQPAVAAAASRPPAARPTPTPISYPADGGNQWSYAEGEAPAPGGAGRLWRYRVAVERDIQGLPVAAFAAEVTRTLSGPQGWTADGTRQLRRVGRDQAADFTIYLATPSTRDVLCQDVPDGYTSCRNGARVVLNVARWVKGVPGYGASLAVYRQYMVNHEVGHRLGMGHERCPGRGRPAPVMQQQTLGLHGCVPNALPYLDGERYTGPSGSYDDPVPPRDRGRSG
ncbi:DUF3152 domain-containing protein [Micromonospora sp. WMMD812]|uniref:DUF3152 domain-containing protein n=1 Tax=Micromonospora sp. WMMD812 TaxID=3015152 RepID=UPI00248AB369|nr:DUF3152 domain-containing protein [Micromonospora sp. WMMD812]WBB67892.1 DUF3152 domain-containing protein [Micromonospora sp. WMMD812]